jgi:dihydroflavonol-4-reductase
MNILLIGATGQIGYTLTLALSSTDHQISILVRDRHKLPFPSSVRVIEQPEFNRPTFIEALSGMNHVIYGVGLPEQFFHDDTIFERINYIMLETFLDVFKDREPKELTYISTYEVFEDIDGLIRESNPIADEAHMTPYFTAMTRAYRMAIEFSNQYGINLGTIHPAAVYGGLATGFGFTNFIEDLVSRKIWRNPTIIDGKFPLVHVDSLADGIIKSIGQPGAFIISDQMTSLKEIAITLRKHAPSYIPPTAPLGMVKAVVPLMEATARMTNTRPVISSVQIDFLTKGQEPKADKAVAELGWNPMPLDDGIQKYLTDRKSIYGQ